MSFSRGDEGFDTEFAESDFGGARTAFMGTTDDSTRSFFDALNGMKTLDSMTINNLEASTGAAPGGDDDIMRSMIMAEVINKTKLNDRDEDAKKERLANNMAEFEEENRQRVQSKLYPMTPSGKEFSSEVRQKIANHLNNVGGRSSNHVYWVSHCGNHVFPSTLEQSNIRPDYVDLMRENPLRTAKIGTQVPKDIPKGLPTSKYSPYIASEVKNWARSHRDAVKVQAQFPGIHDEVVKVVPEMIHNSDHALPYDEVHAAMHSALKAADSYSSYTDAVNRGITGTTKKFGQAVGASPPFHMKKYLEGFFKGFKSTQPVKSNAHFISDSAMTEFPAAELGNHLGERLQKKYVAEKLDGLQSSIQGHFNSWGCEDQARVKGFKTTLKSDNGTATFIGCKYVPSRDMTVTSPFTQKDVKVSRNAPLYSGLVIRTAKGMDGKPVSDILRVHTSAPGVFDEKTQTCCGAQLSYGHVNPSVKNTGTMLFAAQKPVNERPTKMALHVISDNVQ